jgi:hypothetical protein
VLTARPCGLLSPLRRAPTAGRRPGAA